MKPKFRNTQDWEQAQILMQPILIRVVDHLRQRLEQSDWQGTYEEVETPYPGYKLCLTQQDQTIRVALWELCFQVCFLQYSITQTDEEIWVDVDSRLLDESGEVEWEILDDKVKQVIQDFFVNLPQV